MVGCFPCGGSHTQVNLDHCYPPSKQLVAAGPDYKPLNEDLSKLIALLSGKPNQLTKTGEDLEARVNKEARGSSGGYAKSRASLLISLSILRSLIKECAPDLPLFSRSALRIIVTALDVKVYQKGGADAGVVSRAASCFTAFATYTDGSPIGSDATVTKDYLSALSKFGRMAVENDQGAVAVTEKPVLGEGRTRIIGLASLSAAAGSDALLSSEKVFSQQVDIIIPVLLSNLFESSLDDLKLEAERLQNDTTSSPFFSEFSARRAVNDRRTPSIREKAAGEKASTADIPSATLRCLKALMAQCQWNQASTVIEAVFAYLDKRRWSDVERCCFLIELLAKFTSDQYRYIVPTRLVEVLADIPDSAPTPKQSTVLAMLTTVLNSPSPLVGLGVSDIVDNLLSIIIRRIHINDRDSLLPPLVQCVASLGAHIHYADQVNVIIEEISLRLAEISPVDKNRSEILRVLVHCMTGVLRVVHVADDRETARNPPVVPVSADKGKGPQIDTPIEPIPQRPTSSRRNPVALQVWQETLTLLCESSYAVRSVYARALLLFLEREMPREGSGVKAGDDAVASFCNALHAALYTLAMSACLGTGSSADESPTESISGSPVRTTNPRLPETDGENPTKGVSFNLVEPTPSDTPQSTHTPPNGQRTPPRKRRQSRRVSLPLNRLNSSNFIPLASFDNVATPLDFAYIVKILETLRSVIPVTALLTGGPMLFALDAAAGTELVRRSGDGRSGAWVLERKRGVRETVGLVWRGVGKKWNVGMVDDLATKCVAGLPEPFVIPNLYTPDESDILPPPDEPLSFTQNMIEGESSSASKPLLDSEIIISALASSSEVQKATHLDAGDIVKRLGAAWSVETALRDSIGHSNNVDLPSDAHFNNMNPLMTNTNPSYRSFSKTQASPTRAVGVADLREALNQGQGPAIGPSRGSSIVSTVGTGGRSFSGDGASGLGMNGHGYAIGMLGNGRKEDVREVLKDIFREKKRNVAGKEAQGQLSTAVRA